MATGFASINAKRKEERIVNCISYLCDVLDNRNLKYYYRVNIQDKELMKKHHQSNSTNTKNLLSELGIITDTDNRYIVGKKCKQYLINIKKLILLADSYKITHKNYFDDKELLTDKVLNRYKNLDKPVNELIEELHNRKSKVKIGAVNIRPQYEDAAVKSAAKIEYGQFNEVNKDIKIVKDNCDESMTDYLTLEPTVKRGPKGYISRIGARATSPLCNLPSLKNHPERSYYGTRERYLDKRFGKNNWVEYDVHGSIPRTAHLMKLGIYEDPNADPYEIMFGDFDYSVVGLDNWCKSTREAMKGYFMRLYFGGSVKKICRDMRRNSDYLTQFDNFEDIIADWKQRVVNYCGECDSQETSMFLDESCIYIVAKRMLIEMGINSAMVYDAFYLRKDEQVDMDLIIYNASIEWVNRMAKYNQ